MSTHLKGNIHSVQSLGTLDGPGVRFVVFMQGCNLRCSCCHNPDTWDMAGGTQYTPEQIINKAIRYKDYFGKDGGLTVSGGEPLLQAEFVYELFKLCHENDINTCLDTSGSILTDTAKTLLSQTDRVLLDIKYTTDELYLKHVGCDMSKVMAFLDYLNKEKIPTTLRQVIVPTVNDNEANIHALKEIIKKYPCIDKAELLPFRKICQVKYDDMELTFPFGHLPEANKNDTDKMQKRLGF
ncbi:MAG: pyruvate formate lyase-activating protein [Clostridia bacterium]|nr:pyruvate formate lyase-activating protein [Clostridia bacterium]